MSGDSTLPYTSIERLRSACFLYDLGWILEAYRCMSHIAQHEVLLVDHRVDACRYLFASGDEDLKVVSQDVVLSFIENTSLDSFYRYKIIAGYISKRGISTLLSSKLNISYDEKFVCGLQKVFFYSDEDDPRNKILSGQHLLQMSSECMDSAAKEDVCRLLLVIAKNTELENDVRADAADVLLRTGVDNYVSTAREVISHLGYSEVLEKRAASAAGGEVSLLSKAKTIYNNSQNVHNSKVEEGVEKFITKIVMSNEPLADYDSVRGEIIGHIERL